MSEKRYRQLSVEDRETIERGLSARLGCAEIARSIGVSTATVSREIKRNRRDEGCRIASGGSWGNNNTCALRKNCDLTALCMTCTHLKSPLCSRCKTVDCTSRCSDYEREICPQLASFPHTCNGCGSYRGCRKHRWRYSAHDAQVFYESRQREAREGLDCMPEELEETTGIIKEGLAKGQGLAHIYAAHGDELCFSRRTCYRLIKNGAIAITPMDLPKAVGYKPRNKKAAARETMPKDVIEGRRYADFCALDEEQHYRVVEMDCVVGPQGSHDAILTLHFKALHFQIGMKLVRKDTAHVVAAFDALYALLEHDEFRRLFGLILCDRGSEFYDVLGMEYKGDARRCSLYYCDPRRSDQKGACEKNHVELRKLLPKGTPLGNIDQWKLADAFSHINSLRRDSLYGRCPMELAKAIMPDSFLEALGYSLIDADDVFLSPKLLWPDGVPEA